MSNIQIVYCVVFLLLLSACNDPQYVQGKALYTHNCANCHIEDGSGLRGIVPPLAGSDFLKNNLADLPCLVRFGLKSGKPINGKIYELDMPPNPDMTDVEIANLMNYLTNEWGAKEPFVQNEKVTEAIKNCK